MRHNSQQSMPTALLFQTSSQMEAWLIDDTDKFDYSFVNKKKC